MLLQQMIAGLKRTTQVQKVEVKNPHNNCVSCLSLASCVIT